MNAFLYEVARHYYDLHGSSIRHLTFVFPSERSALFFRRYLGQIATKSLFVPECTTISKFLSRQVASYTLLDRTALLFELYMAYREVRNEESIQSFDEFLFWGNIILQDFDLIDRYLISAKHLYRNLEHIKELTGDLDFLDADTLEVIERFWKGFHNPSKMTDEERETYRRNFMDFWLSLNPLYERFRDRLTAQGYMYEGQMYRYLAEHRLDTVDRLAQGVETTRERHGVGGYVFVGLFDLSPSEMKIMQAIRHRGIAEFCWDEAVRVVQDQEHGAHRLMQDNIAKLGNALPPTSIGGTLLPQDIRLVSCASTVTQVKALPEVLRLVKPDSTQSDIDTAVILPSEQLLLPVASSVPPEYQQINITIGYPLGRTSVAILLHRWMRLIASEQNGSLMVDRLHSLLSMQLLGSLYPGILHVAEHVRRQRRYLLSTDWILDTYLPRLVDRLRTEVSTTSSELPNQIEDALPIIRLLLSPRKDAIDFLGTLSALLDTLGERMMQRDISDRDLQVEEASDAELQKVKMSFDLEFVYHYGRLVTRLSDLLQTHQIHTGIESAIRLLEGLSHTITIPFEGNPLQGLQIMGMLESRALHFSHLVYLSAQEGMLPRRQQTSTLIPYALRRGFGLPLQQWYDDAEAYRFYQSIARAQSLVLIYGEDDPLGGKGEVSRYTRQMSMLYGATLRYINIQLPLEAPERVARAVSKDHPDTRTILSTYISSGVDARYLSPSAVICYLTCPLLFYYEYVLGVRREETAEMLMAANDFGTILHDTMQVIYAAAPGGVISAEYITACLGDTERLRYIITRQYNKCYTLDGAPSRDLSSRGLAQYYIGQIYHYIEDILQYDLMHTPFTYRYSEANMRLRLALQDGRRVNIKGFIDRIDLCNIGGQTRLRILDYKTGKDTITPFVLPSSFIQDPSKYKAILQTLLYAEMVHSGYLLRDGQQLHISEASTHPIVPGLLLTRALSRDYHSFSPYFTFKQGGLGGESQETPLLDYTEDVRTEFIRMLDEILTELLDLNRPFTPTSDIKRCQHCAFADICGR